MFGELKVTGLPQKRREVVLIVPVQAESIGASVVLPLMVKAPSEPSPNFSVQVDVSSERNCR